MVQWSRRAVRTDPEAAAVKLASQGEGEGMVIVDHRRGEPTLRFSVILRPVSPRDLGLLRLIISFSTSDGIRKDTGIITWLRWPDKIVAEKKSLATTSMIRGPGVKPKWVVLTSSIRTGRGATKGEETSLMDLLGVDVDSDLLVEKVLDSLSWMYYGWTRGMADHIVARVGPMLDMERVQVAVSDREEQRVGRVKGIDAKGSLVVEFESGEESIPIGSAERVKDL